MILNGVMAVIVHHFTEVITFGAKYVTVFKRPTLSVMKMQPKESTFWQYMIYDETLRDY